MPAFNPGNAIYWFINLLGGLANFGTLFNWFIILGGIGLALGFGKKERRLRRDLLGLKAALIGSGVHDARQVIEQHFEAQPASVLSPFWQEYRKALILGEEDQVVPDVLRFFNRSDLLDAGARRSVETVPTLLTMAGILGTFLGLVAGLQGLNVANSTGLSSGITQLIAGLSLKFTASVIGILLALVWIIVDKMWWKPRLIHEVTALQALLVERFSAPTEELVLQQLRALETDQRDNLNSLVNDALLPRLIDGFGQVMEERVVPHLAQLGTTLETISRDTAHTQTEALESIAKGLVNDLSAQSQAFFHDLTDALARTVETQNTLASNLSEFTGSVSAALAGLREAVALETTTIDSTRALIGELQETAAVWQAIPGRMAEEATLFAGVVGNMRESLEATVKTLADHQTAAYQHLLTYAEHLDELSERLRSDIDGSMRSLLNGQEATTGRLGSLMEQVQSVNQVAVSRFEEAGRMGDVLQQQWDVQLEQARSVQETMREVVSAVESVGGDINEAVTTLRSEVTRTVESLERNLASGLRKTFEEFDKELSGALKHLSAAVQNMSELVREIQVPADSMRKMAVGTERVVENLREMSEAAENTARRLQVIAGDPV